MKPREYFCGRDSMWNLFDVTLSLVAVVEVCLSVILSSAGATGQALNEGKHNRKHGLLKTFEALNEV